MEVSTMKISSMAELDIAKAELKIIINKLHEDNLDIRAYSPPSSSKRLSRYIYIIPDIKRRRRIEREINKSIIIKDAISLFYGDKDRRNNLAVPLLLNKVALVRVWVNDAVSSRRETSSKSQIINKLNHLLEIANRHDTSDNRKRAKKLESEIETYSNSEEEQYIVRSPATQDVSLRVYYENLEDEALRLTVAGLFIVGEKYEAPKIVTPDSSDGTKQRRKRKSAFAALTPLQYSGAPSSLLYKQSEVHAEKMRLGMIQSDIVDSKKNKQRA